MYTHHNNFCCTITIVIIYDSDWIIQFMTIGISQTSIAYLNSVAAKNKDIFPNPEMFDPERWARDKPNPFALLLFGFGPRMCYGELHGFMPRNVYVLVHVYYNVIIHSYYRKEIC